MIQLTILVKIYTGLEELLLLHAGTEVSEGNPWWIIAFKVIGNYMGSMQQFNFETQKWILTL